MSLRYKFNRARALLATLTAEERPQLDRICRGIQKSQEALLANAAPAMQQCLHNCEGLCCRNARVDDIIGLWDLVYILTLTPEFEETLAIRVENEKPFYSADCMFLEGRSGPCIFTSSIRPEVCITTFCSGDQGIQKEIRNVKRQFFRINWFFLRRQPQAVLRFMQRIVNMGRIPAPAPSSPDPAQRRLMAHRRSRGDKNG